MALVMEKEYFNLDEGYIGNVKIGGINTSVLRELSGLYQPFEKALKELVVNGMDAGATDVRIRLKDDFSHITIEDNGSGMTSYQFKNKYLYIGNSDTDSTDLDSRVGGKGIGFLAPARYCRLMRIETTTTQELSFSKHVDSKSKIAKNELYQDGILSQSLLNQYLKVLDIKSGVKSLTPDENYIVDDDYIRFKEPYTDLQVTFSIDFSELVLEAVIDFEYLLGRDNNLSLDQIEDFCNITIKKNLDDKEKSYTIIDLIELNDFLKNILQQPRKKGNVRNISSMEGIKQFIWNFKNSIPIKFEECPNLPDVVQEKLLSRKNTIEKVYLQLGEEWEELRKPVYNPPHKLNEEYQDLWEVIDINEADFIAEGYILGQQNIIYPSELRGLSIKVKNVEIGSPTFLGLENSLTGAKKAALNQITGEINILKGMDAIEEITPGRDGFYKESKGYNTLYKYLTGDDEEAVRGSLGKIINAIINRSQMTASVENMFQRASGIREALLQVSYSINSYLTGQPELMQAFVKPAAELILAERENYTLSAEQLLKTFKIEKVDELEKPYIIDYLNKTVTIDESRDIWNREIFIMGDYYRVIFKKGKEVNKLCEIDVMNHEILVNWDHPTRTLMGDRFYIKNAISWAVSLAGFSHDPDQMINSVLHLTTLES